MKNMKKYFPHRENGFTMIELLITIGVLGILAAVIIPNVAGFIKNSHVAAANAELAAIQTAAQAYYADNTADAVPITSVMLKNAGIITDLPKYGVYTFSATAELTGVVNTALATTDGLVAPTSPNWVWTK
jgi:type IV pilus assembly protein PilA